ncbi:helix-turn-helix domain-containing protein [Luedemannella helvata]|uniref:TetR/AcrR family transcriptional regulator n=1 Tax=Luedemannella helvata TaxID=349315 RepID=A0ABN2JUV8_9ACTN
MTAPRRPNLGRSAAQANRRALLAAAVEVFAEGGIDAPLSAVARRAGVGQGSLYRHFPDRISLAMAVFEENVARLESLATDPTCTLDGMLATITRMVINSVAFVDLVMAGGAEPRLDAINERVRATLAGPLAAARRAGRIRESVGLDDLMLAIGMIAAIVARTPAADRRATADSGWALLNRALRP